MSAPTTLAGATVIVTGASRGFGRGIAEAFLQAGAHVVGVARTAADLGPRFTSVVADVTDPDLPQRLLADHRPSVVVLNAGAEPRMAPLHHHDWASFSACWETDVQQAFRWCQAALRHPLPDGAAVLSMSSLAAVKGSPLSGGYAGAKAALRFVSAYAAGEAQQAGIATRFVAVLPMLTPGTDLGAGAVEAYAAQQGIDAATFVERMGPTLTPALVGAAVVGLATDPTATALAYGVTPAGVAALS